MKDKFELAVEDMLAEQARVARSTIDLTRASIAVLPDRRSSNGPHFGLRLPSTSIRQSPLMSLIGVGALIVAVVAVSLFGRFRSSALGPGSPTASMATPVQTASASASAAPSPSPTARPTAAFHETLPVVFTGGLLEVAGWAPDGLSFAIVESTKSSSGFGTPTDPTVHIFDRGGAEIDSLRGERFAWLSSGNYVILRADASTGSGGRIVAYTGWVGSPLLTRLGNYDNLVAGPSGQVALMLPWNDAVDLQPQYVVLSAGSVSEPRDGYPAAWSRDGSMLAVFRVTGPTGQRAVGSRSFGGLEVLRSTGERVASAPQVRSDVTAQVAFSPDGTRVAFSDDGNAAGAGVQTGALEVASGHLATIPKFGHFTWADSETLLFVDPSSDVQGESTHIYSWSTSTGQLGTYGIGNSVGASGAGIVVVGDDAAHRITWTNSTPGSTRGVFMLGSGPWLGSPDVAWSPDGNVLILISGEATEPNMDAVLTQF